MSEQKDSILQPKIPLCSEQRSKLSACMEMLDSTWKSKQSGAITYTPKEKTTEEIKNEEANKYPSVLGLGAEETGRVFYLISTLQKLLVTGEFKENYILIQELSEALQKLMLQNLSLKTAVDQLTVELVKPKFKVNFRHY